ncbi:vanadium-dependent haloperoxidase [Pontixanthobacter gangjinensis]
MILFVLGSCEKDAIEPGDTNLSFSADAKAIQNFNNGMINSYSNEVVLQWYEITSQNLDQRLPQPLEVRIYAMIGLAIHDALNNVVPKYETYGLDNSGVDASGISKKNIKSIADAAVSQAARDMLVQLFPPSAAAANARLGEILSGIEESDLRDRGVAIGSAAAAAVIAKRSGDFPLGWSSYTEGSAPGEYQANYMPYAVANPIWPNNAVFGQNIGELEPFGIESADQFIEEAPYPVTSSAYAADFNEVKLLGCLACPTRTAEQTEIGLFWVETSSSAMNRLTRSLIAERKLDGWEAARLAGLVQMSVMDAYIASFKEKWHFKYWRPVTAIRAADADGNDATAGDASWTSVLPTPPNPQFPQTSAYSGGAVAEILRSFFHSDQLNMDVTSPYTSPGVTRHLKTFSDMAHEKGIYGIYLGHEFRYGTEIGEKHGRKLGKYVFENNLRELKKI